MQRKPQVGQQPKSASAAGRDFKEQVTSAGICGVCKQKRAQIPVGDDGAICRYCYASYLRGA